MFSFKNVNTLQEAYIFFPVLSHNILLKKKKKNGILSKSEEWVCFVMYLQIRQVWLWPALIAVGIWCSDSTADLKQRGRCAFSQNYTNGPSLAAFLLVKSEPAKLSEKENTYYFSLLVTTSRGKKNHQCSISVNLNHGWSMARVTWLARVTWRCSLNPSSLALTGWYWDIL